MNIMTIITHLQTRQSEYSIMYISYIFSAKFYSFEHSPHLLNWFVGEFKELICQFCCISNKFRQSWVHPLCCLKDLYAPHNSHLV